jgi:hypothetical protein
MPRRAAAIGPASSPVEIWSRISRIDRADIALRTYLDDARDAPFEYRRGGRPRIIPVPKMRAIAINELRPTQITVGLIEVDEKRRHIKELRDHPHHLEEYVASHAIPAVAGYHGHYFLVDHHHLGRALWDAGIKAARFDLIGDLSKLEKDAFWKEMDHQHWVHPYDEHGQKQHYETIPHHLKELRDDPYRSLAAYVRNGGGYQKTPAPFAEFLWADYFRKHIVAGAIASHFEKTVQTGIELARAAAAAHLPGHVKAGG